MKDAKNKHLGHALSAIGLKIFMASHPIFIGSTGFIHERERKHAPCASHAHKHLTNCFCRSTKCFFHLRPVAMKLRWGALDVVACIIMPPSRNAFKQSSQDEHHRKLLRLQKKAMQPNWMTECGWNDDVPMKLETDNGITDEFPLFNAPLQNYKFGIPVSVGDCTSSNLKGVQMAPQICQCCLHPSTPWFRKLYEFRVFLSWVTVTVGVRSLTPALHTVAYRSPNMTPDWSACSELWGPATEVAAAKTLGRLRSDPLYAFGIISVKKEKMRCAISSCVESLTQDPEEYLFHDSNGPLSEFEHCLPVAVFVWQFYLLLLAPQKRNYSHSFRSPTELNFAVVLFPNLVSHFCHHPRTPASPCWRTRRFSDTLCVMCQDIYKFMTRATSPDWRDSTKTVELRRFTGEFASEKFQLGAPDPGELCGHRTREISGSCPYPSKFNTTIQTSPFDKVATKCMKPWLTGTACKRM